jgi:hypothetical protein
MRRLIFLSKIALICNLFFAVCFVLRYHDFVHNNDVNALLLILGWLMPPILNTVFCLGIFSLVIKRKPSPVASWVTIVNMLFLLFQILFFFVFNARNQPILH